MIPDKAGMHRARLKMHVNMEESIWGNNGLDTLLACHLLVADTLVEKEDIIYRTFNASKFVDSTKTYNFNDLAPFVRYWNRNDEQSDKKNCMVDILQYFEKDLDYQTDRMIFHGIDDPNKDLRPKLTIIYSTRPDVKNCEKTDNE
jgi:hypothetical protein